MSFIYENCFSGKNYKMTNINSPKFTLPEIRQSKKSGDWNGSTDDSQDKGEGTQRRQLQNLPMKNLNQTLAFVSNSSNTFNPVYIAYESACT